MSIKTLSPYLLTIPLVNPISSVVCTQFTVKVYAWAGELSAIPAEPLYVITKINAAASSGSEKMDISKLINDVMEFSCVVQTDTNIVDGNNQVWVKYECYYSDMPSFPSINTIELATKGYGYTMEGTNPQLPSNKILLTGDEFKVNRGGLFVLPFMVEEATPPDERHITVDNFSRKIGYQYEIEVTADFSYTDLYVFVRAVGDVEWIPCTPSGPLFIVPSGIAADLFEVMASAYDIESGMMIYSEPYTIIAVKIYKITPTDMGHATTVYSQVNITISAFKVEALGFSGPGWSDLPSSGTGPTYISWTPEGDFTIRIKLNNTWYSNEVPLTIPLTSEIIIP